MSHTCDTCKHWDCREIYRHIPHLNKKGWVKIRTCSYSNEKPDVLHRLEVRADDDSGLDGWIETGPKFSCGGWEPSWTNTPPTVKGYYWIRTHAGQPIVAWIDPVTETLYLCNASSIVLTADYIATQNMEFWTTPITF